jgi:class 3 adenylate cyclase
VTFLFTDIEGSTLLWEADADAMRVALAAHDAILREAVESRGGWLFKHTGDGVCAVFMSARAAVDAAVDAQRRLECRYVWESVPARPSCGARTTLGRR